MPRDPEMRQSTTARSNHLFTTCHSAVWAIPGWASTTEYGDFAPPRTLVESCIIARASTSVSAIRRTTVTGYCADLPYRCNRGAQFSPERCSVLSAIFQRVWLFAVLGLGMGLVSLVLFMRRSVAEQGAHLAAE